ncbi:hypothetical protein [Massilia sp. KIM]|uniref:hypothetical protein n=1 Tax=Massilia sp. KIM TaxID=1955422 RepID=UPI00117CC278|nr:hypothetical protein [Massilia sp. KIM]
MSTSLKRVCDVFKKATEMNEQPGSMRRGNILKLLIGQVSLVQVRVFGEVLCVEMARIVEVVNGSDSCLNYALLNADVAMYHGHPIPHLDWRGNRAGSPKAIASVAIIAKVQKRLVAISVDEVLGMLMIDYGKIERVDQKMFSDYPFMCERVTSGGINMPVIDIDMLLSPSPKIS